MGPAPPCAPGSARASGRHQLATSVSGQRFRGRQKGGERTGPNPTDRGRSGSKRHVVTDANGIPLAIRLTAANIHDSRVFEDLIDAVPPIRQRRGRPRRRPAKLHADKAYDVPRCCEALRWRRVKARIARRGVDSSERLGRHRWVVERTLAWFSRFRRLTVRYERQADMHQAFPSLAESLICWSYVQRRSGEAPIRIAQPAATGRGKVASCPA